MDNRPLWAIKVATALGRIRDDYSEVEAALGRVREGYREVAETIEDARRADPTLEQVIVAQHIGKSTTWVSRLLKWHKDGCKSESPFGDEIAARRKAAKLENAIATSQFEGDPTIREEDLGQLRLQGGRSDYVPGRAEATLRAFSLIGACQALIKAAAGVRRKTLMLVRSSDDDKRIFTLEKLATELEHSITTSEAVLSEVRSALKKNSRVLQAAE